jgi:hypothetical protein
LSLRWVALLLALVYCPSCGATEPAAAGDYFIRYQANGVLIEYREDPLLHGLVTQFGAQHALGAEGASSPGSPVESSLNVSVFDVTPIVTRTYVGYQTVTGGFTSAGLTYRTGGVEYNSNVSDADNRVTVTEITPVYLRGTFSGTVRAPGRPEVVITNGEFYVPTHAP